MTNRLFDGQINPDEVFDRQAPLVVEVGFGMGASLIEMAKSEHEKNFIFLNHYYDEKNSNSSKYLHDSSLYFN